MVRIYSTLFFLLLSFLIHAQPFSNEIRAFQRQDSIDFPPKDKILFVGSSSFRLWKDMDTYFPEHTLINRGFGGATFPDIIRYADKVIYPYKPKQVVIYCGDNDLASKASAEQVAAHLQQLVELIRDHLPKAHIAYVSIKPSPSRKHLMPEMAKANQFIKNYLSGKKNTAYIDVYSPMLTSSGAPREELFTQDMLHMNAEGYAIWKKAIKPHLR